MRNNETVYHKINRLYSKMCRFLLRNFNLNTSSNTSSVDVPLVNMLKNIPALFQAYQLFSVSSLHRYGLCPSSGPAAPRMQRLITL